MLKYIYKCIHLNQPTQARCLEKPDRFGELLKWKPGGRNARRGLRETPSHQRPDSHQLDLASPNQRHSIQLKQTEKRLSSNKRWRLNWTLSVDLQLFWSLKLSYSRTFHCNALFSNTSLLTTLKYFTETSLLQGKLSWDWVGTRRGTSQSARHFPSLHMRVFTCSCSVPLPPYTQAMHPQEQNCFCCVHSMLSNP